MVLSERPSLAKARLALQSSVFVGCGLASFLLASIIHVRAGALTEISADLSVAKPDAVAVYVYKGDSYGLTPEELRELAARLGASATVAGFTQPVGVVGTPDLRYLHYVGVTENYFSVLGLRLQSGRLPREYGECVLGAAVARETALGTAGLHRHPWLETPLTVVGYLQPATGTIAPPASSPPDFGDITPDTCVFCWERIPRVLYPHGDTLESPGLHVLVEPKPGQQPHTIVESAREFVLERYPGAGVLVGVGSVLQMTLRAVQGNLERHYAYLAGTYLLLVSLVVVNLTLYDIARNWREIALRRCLGATRLDVWARQASAPLLLSALGTGAGVVFAALWGGRLADALGLPWDDCGTAAVVPIVLVLVLIATLATSLKATSIPPNARLHGPAFRARRHRLDVRKLLACGTLALAVACMLIVTACGRSGLLEMKRLLAAAGENVVLVRLPLGADELSAECSSVLSHTLPPSYKVARQTLLHLPLEHGGRVREVPVYGVEGSFLELRGWTIARRDGKRSDGPGSGECYIGSTLYRVLFAEADPVGQQVLIAGKRLRIAGVVAERPSQILDLMSDRDSSVIVCLDDLTDVALVRAQTGAPDVWVAAPHSVELSEALDVVASRLTSFTDVHVEPLVAGIQALATARRAGTTFLTAFSLSGLVIAAFGVSACFAALSLDRRRERAIRRVLGATKRTIRGMVLRESCALGLTASGIGALVGMVVSLVVWRAQGWPDPFVADLLLVAVTASLVVALTSLLPTALDLSKENLHELLRTGE